MKADRSLMNYHSSKEDIGPSSEEKAVNEYWSVSTFLFCEKNAMSQGRSHLLVYFSKHIFWWRNSRSNKLFTLLNLWQLQFLTRIWWFCGIVSVRSYYKLSVCILGMEASGIRWAHWLAKPHKYQGRQLSVTQEESLAEPDKNPQVCVDFTWNSSSNIIFLRNKLHLSVNISNSVPPLWL